MTVSRRTFLQTSAALSASAGLGAAGLASASAHAAPSARRRGAGEMKVLILGGTRFLGPALVHSCLTRGWEVTLFNRGRTNPDLFPDLETILGDRDPNVGDGLKGLEGRTWDAVLDTSGYVPRIARASAELLASNVGQYLFISSVSAYADQSRAGISEDDPPATMVDETNENVNQFYGALKAACERAIEQVMPGRTTNVRPGLIVGPEDGTDRFTYWPVRVSQGGEVLAPGNPDDPVQVIDVRDLAEFCVHCVETKTTGLFNAVGPEGTMTVSMMLHGCWAAIGGDVRFTFVPAAFLSQHNVSPWSNMPAWVPPPPTGGTFAGLGSVSNARAVAAGMRFRPLAETVRDTLEWWRSEPEGERRRLLPEAEFASNDTPQTERRFARRAGLSSAKEQQVLRAWHESNAAG